MQNTLTVLTVSDHYGLNVPIVVSSTMYHSLGDNTPIGAQVIPVMRREIGCELECVDLVVILEDF